MRLKKNSIAQARCKPHETYQKELYLARSNLACIEKKTQNVFYFVRKFFTWILTLAITIQYFEVVITPHSAVPINFNDKNLLDMFNIRYDLRIFLQIAPQSLA